MNRKNRIYIVLLIALYAVINYLGYTYKFDFIYGQVVFIKDSSEFINNNDKVLLNMGISETDFTRFFFTLNLHIFIICIFLQYKISMLLNGNNSIKILLSILIFIFLTRHMSKVLTQIDNYILRWFGLNTFSRSLKVYNFLLYFPSMPFLIFIINKSLADKLKIKSK